jgi:hypothetical protein
MIHEKKIAVYGVIANFSFYRNTNPCGCRIWEGDISGRILF